MAKPREYLRNAPIVEAVIDFRVPPSSGIQPSAFSELTATIGKKYSKSESINLIETRFGIDRGKMLDPAQSQTELGWKYSAETEIVQFRINGFTFSKVAPYTTWGEVFGEAFRLWQVYLNIAKPVQLTRIAVRYINKMQVEGDRKIGDFLEAPPTLPPTLSSTVLDFLTRVHLADQKRGAAAIVVQALEPQLDPTLMSLYVDIDAYHLASLEPDSPRLPEIFQRLRELKNEIFYASITELAVEKYQ